jgi:hypothetical protein
VQAATSGLIRPCILVLVQHLFNVSTFVKIYARFPDELRNYALSGRARAARSHKHNKFVKFYAPRLVSLSSAAEFLQNCFER